MELVVIDSLLTLVQPQQRAGLAAWTQSVLFACELAEQKQEPLWQVLAPSLDSAGWRVEGSSQQAVALPQLPALLRADPALGSLLERRGGPALPEGAAEVLDGWWRTSLAAADADADQLVVLLASLSSDELGHPCAQLHALTLPSPSWRWVVRPHLVQARLNQLSLWLDGRRHAPLADTLADRTRQRQGRVRHVALGSADGMEPAQR